MKNFVGFLAGLLISSAVFAQEGTISGTVTDKVTGETLIGATVVYESGKGVTSDIDGKYTLMLPYGTYSFNVSYVGYETVLQTIVLDKKFVKQDFSLSTTTLREIEVVADIAIEKETPVAFTNIKPAQINQELGTNDVPMLLKSTPGVYSTATGGSDGGPRVAIRGFQERNISVLIDGIPINNMDDGHVFWSNTFGIDAVLANLQVQRGLTSSKLALPAIGGTINYITKSIENKESVFVQQSYGSFNTFRTSLGYNSGRLKNGWGYSLAGSFRVGDGFYEEQFRKEFFYYGKVQKDFGSHIVSFTAMGSPVKYGIRSNLNKIAVYDADYAAGLFKGNDDLYRRLSAYSVAQNRGRESQDNSQRNALAEQYGWGTYDENGNFIIDESRFADIATQNDFIDTAGVISEGIRYNNHWGYLNGNVKNERLRDYHKPIFALSDFWHISERLNLSNKVYYSYGKGGVTNLMPYLGYGDYDQNLQVDFQRFYNANTNVSPPFFPAISPLYSATEKKSGSIMRKVFNNHYWLGLLSTLDFQMNESWSFAGGLDFRYYSSQTYATLDDLLGGDYYVPDFKSLPQDRSTAPASRIYRKGDKYDINSENIIRWGAFFGEAKYKKDDWTAFLNLSGVISGYKRIDYFGNKDFIADDGTRYANAIGYGDQLFYNGSEVLVAADNVNIGTSHWSQSGDTTFVHNPKQNLNDYAPDGDEYILNAERVTYDDPRTQTSETPWKNIPGFTIKTGVGYSINENHNVFVNLGYLSRTPRFRNVIDISNLNQFFRDIENEKIASVEFGYGYSENNLAINFNAYYTDWRNRPYEGGVRVRLPGREISVQANINAMNAVHQGIEINSVYNITKSIKVEAFAAIGDWRWTSSDTVYFYDDNGILVTEVGPNGELTDKPRTIVFDAKGIAVGDAPQTQIGGSLRYNFLKEDRAYVQARYTYFARYYTDFDPLQLHDEKAGKQSWEMPNYGLTSFIAGYNFEISKVRFDINFVIDNLFNIKYLADGENNKGDALVTTNYLNSPPQATVSFDANSAAVYFGLPRTFGISVKATL